MSAHVATHVAIDLGPHGEESAVAPGGDFQLANMLPRVVGGNHVLAAVLNPLDGPAQLNGGEGDDEVFGVELAGDSEPATHVALDEVDAVLRHL